MVFVGLRGDCGSGSRLIVKFLSLIIGEQMDDDESSLEVFGVRHGVKDR